MSVRLPLWGRALSESETMVGPLRRRLRAAWARGRTCLCPQMPQHVNPRREDLKMTHAAPRAAFFQRRRIAPSALNAR